MYMYHTQQYAVYVLSHPYLEELLGEIGAVCKSVSATSNVPTLALCQSNRYYHYT